MKTRIGRKMDIGRLSSAVKRPGIDTRCWVSLAVALGDSFVDKDHGVFVNVILMPTEEEYTARVGAEYAGGGFGFYAKIKKADELFVGTPSWDPWEGIVVLKRMWSAADLPPQQAIDDPEEVMLIIEQDKNLRMVVSGSGQIFVEAEDNVNLKTTKQVIAESDGDFSIKSGATALIEAAIKVVASSPKVLLGSDAAPDALVKGTTYRIAEAVMNGTLGGSLTAAGSSLTTAGTDALFAASFAAAAAAIAAAGGSLTAAGAAVTAFEAAAATYLSLVSSTD